MGKRRDTQDKLGEPTGGAVASGLAAASLYGVGTANATCVGISGIDIGDGCESTFGNFSIGLGPDTQAHSNGLLTGAIAVGDGTIADVTGILTAAWAGGTGSAAAANGFIAWAVAQGDGEGVGDVAALAGSEPLDIANFAFNFGNATDGATSAVEASDGAVQPRGQSWRQRQRRRRHWAPRHGHLCGRRLWELRNQCYRQPEQISAGGGFLNNATNAGQSIYVSRTAATTMSLRATGNLSVAFNVPAPLYRSLRC